MADIVVGYDGSEHAKAAVADRRRPSREAWATASWSSSATSPRRSGASRPTCARRSRRRVASCSPRRSSTIDHEGVELEALLVDERPEDALVRIGKERNARCLVVGTRGEGPVTAAILGSVSHKLLHVADRPVLVVPALRSRLGPCARS